MKNHPGSSTPRRLTVLLPLCCAGLGYWCASLTRGHEAGKSAGSGGGRTGAVFRNREGSVPSPAKGDRARWAGGIAKARLVPVSRSEEAWVKWAFSVPDEDIPSAVSRLNPRTDLHPLRLLFSRWARLDPEEAFRVFDRTGIPERLNSWYQPESGDHGLPGFSSATLEQQPGTLIRMRMIHAWSQVDPTAATAYARKLLENRPAEDSRRGGYDFLKYELGEFVRDQESASRAGAAAAAGAGEEFLKLLRELPGSEARTPPPPGLSGAFSAFAEASPADALRLLKDLPEDQRRIVDESFTPAWAFRNAPPSVRQEAIATLMDRKIREPLPEAELKRMVSGNQGMGFSGHRNTLLENGRTALKEWAEQDLQAAKAWLESRPDGQVTSFLTGELAGTLVRTSPVQAVELLQRVSAEEMPTATASLVTGWSQKDAGACAEWVGRIEDVPTRDSGYEAMAVALMGSDPGFALRMGAGISDAKVRGMVYGRIREMMGWNPAAWEALLTGDPEIKTSVERTLVPKPVKPEFDP